MLKAKLLKGNEGLYSAHPAYQNVEMKGLVGPDDSPNLKSALVKVLPGAEITPHTHDTVEIAYIATGSGQIMINGEYLPFSAGDGFYAPAGSLHGLKNTCDEDVLIFANFPSIEE